MPGVDGGGVDLFGLAPFSNPFLEFSQPEEGVTNLSFEDERWNHSRTPQALLRIHIYEDYVTL